MHMWFAMCLAELLQKYKMARTLTSIRIRAGSNTESGEKFQLILFILSWSDYN